MRPTWGPHYWPWYLIAAALAFLVPEVYAVMTNTANTLSDYSWDELGLTQSRVQHGAAWLLTLGVWLVIAFWLTFHIWFRRFR